MVDNHQTEIGIHEKDKILMLKLYSIYMKLSIFTAINLVLKENILKTYEITNGKKL